MKFYTKTKIQQRFDKTGAETPTRKMIICPFCKDPLTNSEMGIKSHIGKHVRLGDVRPEDRTETIRKLFKGKGI